MIKAALIWVMLLVSVVFQTIAQEITKNIIYIEQTGSLNLAFTEQIGFQNEINLIQNGANSKTEAVLFQQGTGNYISVLHDGIENDIAFHEQKGNYNHIDILLQGNENLTSTAQHGNNNFIRIQQAGDNNVFKLQQSGNNNNLGSLIHSFIQMGNNNVFGGIILDEDILAFEVLDYAQQIDGAYLFAESFQKGDDNRIGLHQEMGASAILQQEGNLNGILLWQATGEHISEIKQMGNKNSAHVLQK